MAQLYYPLAGCEQNATERKTAYAALVAHLYKSSFVPSPSSVLADFTAAECDYDGYATENLFPWFDPILAPGSGYLIQSPEVQFMYVDGMTHVGNTVGGAYFVDGGGELRMVLQLGPTEYIPMAANGNGWAFNIADLFPTGL